MSTPEQYSRRSFLSGVLATGTFSAIALYAAPRGRSTPAVELRLTSGTDSTGARDLIITMWNQTNPDITVRVDEISLGSGDERQIMLEQAVRGEADLLNLDVIDVPEFADRELISPIALDGGRQLIGPLDWMNRVSIDDPRYWAVPFNTDVGMLFVRTGDDDRPASRSLSELMATIPDGSQQFVGQLRPSVSAYHEAFVVNVLEHAASSRPGVLKVPDPSVPGVAADLISQDIELWRSALTPLKEAVEAQRVLVSGSEAESRDLFIQPDSPCRYMRNWPVKYRELQQLENPDVRTGRIQVAVMDAGVLGGQSLAVVADSPHVPQARAFIAFASSEVVQKILATHGLAPTAIGAYSDDNLKASIPHLNGVREAVENALPRPAHPNYRRFSAVVKDHVERFLHRDEQLAPHFIDEMMEALA
ncbi:hypothetical protein ACN27F_23680 [Solwaraspora sp. WMMB335]|uniref:hypothetical protein n=1 Tax=Solwaraspora sp. WMMB335 TaxID=3404118 RepID=UPI003B9403B3